MVRICQVSNGPTMKILPLIMMANSSPLSLLLEKVRCEPCPCPRAEQVQRSQGTVQRPHGRDLLGTFAQQWGSQNGYSGVMVGEG